MLKWNGFFFYPISIPKYSKNLKRIYFNVTNFKPFSDTKRILFVLYKSTIRKEFFLRSFSINYINS